MASKLEQHKTLITELQRQGKSYSAIADYLLEKHNLKVDPSTVFSYLDRRRKDEEANAGKDLTRTYITEMLDEVKLASSHVDEWKEDLKKSEERRKENIEDYRRVKEDIEKASRNLDDIYRQAIGTVADICRERANYTAMNIDIKKTMTNTERVLKEKYSPYQPMFYAIAFMCSFTVLDFCMRNLVDFTKDLHWWYYLVLIAAVVFSLVIGCMLTRIKNSVLSIFRKEIMYEQ